MIMDCAVRADDYGTGDGGIRELPWALDWERSVS